jgi:hypothetical protein
VRYRTLFDAIWLRFSAIASQLRYPRPELNHEAYLLKLNGDIGALDTERYFLQVLGKVVPTGSAVRCYNAGRESVAYSYVPDLRCRNTLYSHYYSLLF